MEKSIPQSLLPGTNMTHGHGLDYLLIKDASKFENKMRKLMRNVPPSKRINKYYPIKLSDHSRSSSGIMVPKVSKVIIDLKSDKAHPHFKLSGRRGHSPEKKSNKENLSEPFQKH